MKYLRSQLYGGRLRDFYVEMEWEVSLVRRQGAKFYKQNDHNRFKVAFLVPFRCYRDIIIEKWWLW